MLTVLLVLLLAVVAILAIPVTILFRLSWPDVRENDVRLLWAFGLVRARLSGEPKEDEDSRGESDKAEKRTGRTSRKSKTNVWAPLRQSHFRQRARRFMSDVWAAIQKQDVRLRMRIGLDDPADTGQLWAVFGPVSGVLPSAQDVAIRLEPEFQEETLELAGSGGVRIMPLRLIYLAGGLLFSPAIWRGLRAMRQPTG